MPNSEEVMLTIDQMKRLAEIVTGYEALVCGDEIELREYVPVRFEGPPGGVIAYNPRGKWKPSLTGEDWQQAQALRVIVAAMKISPDTQIHQYKEGYWVLWDDGSPHHDSSPICPDILTASIMALLLHGDTAP